jgi:hypothetical protein
MCIVVAAEQQGEPAIEVLSKGLQIDIRSLAFSHAPQTTTPTTVRSHRLYTLTVCFAAHVLQTSRGPIHPPVSAVWLSTAASLLFASVLFFLIVSNSTFLSHSWKHSILANWGHYCFGLI